MVDFASFVNEYFVNPMRYPDQYAPYNIYNTLAFAIVALVAVYVLFKLLNKYGFTTDKKFTASILPYVVFGSLVRVMTDAQILPRHVELFGVTVYPFITPTIYVLIFAVSICALLVSRLAFKQNWHAPFRNFGILLSFLSLALLAPLFKQFYYVGLIAVIAIAATLAAKFLFNVKREDWESLLVVFSQCFDGAATFVGLSIAGYSEQHVVGNAIIDAAGPGAFFLVKFAFSLLVVYLVKKELVSTSVNQNNHLIASYLLLIISILGLAPGLRDAFRILAAV